LLLRGVPFYSTKPSESTDSKERRPFLALPCFFPPRRRPGFLASGAGERSGCQGLGFLRHLDFYGPSLLLEQGKEPILFILFLGLKSLVTAPAWPLLTTITLSSTDHPERDFGKIRVWGTLGWMGAGLLVSLLAMDLSASVGWLSVGASILAAVCCFLLPLYPHQASFFLGFSLKTLSSKA
jgi:hypothetical protein